MGDADVSLVNLLLMQGSRDGWRSIRRNFELSRWNTTWALHQCINLLACLEVTTITCRGEDWGRGEAGALPGSGPAM